MKTKAIYHKENVEIGIISSLKRMWTSFDKLENRRFEMCIVGFSMAVIPASIAVSFASFIENDLLLALIVFLSVLSLIACILQVPVKWILLIGFVSVIASLGTVIYGLAEHADLLEPYMKLHY